MKKQIKRIVSAFICITIMICAAALFGCQINEGDNAVIAYNDNEINAQLLEKQDSADDMLKIENFDTSGDLIRRSGTYDFGDYIISLPQSDKNTAYIGPEETITVTIGDKTVEGTLGMVTKDGARKSYYVKDPDSEDKLKSAEDMANFVIRHSNFVIDVETGTLMSFNDRNLEYVHNTDGEEAVWEFINGFLLQQGINAEEYEVDTMECDNGYIRYALRRILNGIQTTDTVTVGYINGYIEHFDRSSSNSDYSAVSMEEVEKLASDEAREAVITLVSQVYSDVEEISGFNLRDETVTIAYPRYKLNSNGVLSIVYYVDVYYDLPKLENGGCSVTVVVSIKK